MRGHLQVPGFTVGRRLGDASSPNWLAVHDASGAEVTLRVVSGRAMAIRTRLLAAIDVLRELDHPHVLRYQDMIDRPDDIVIVLEAADGGSLSDLIRARGTLPPGELVTACAPIAEGLAEMHQHGIVHGAVTADDIVFAADGRPMLAGAGLGVLGVWPHPGAVGLAPETVVGAPAEPPADVYSLAYAAYVALSGYQPQAPLNVPGLPASVLGVLSRCLLPTPGHRPDVGVLASAIYGIADPEPVDLVPEQVEATSSMPRITDEPSADAGAPPAQAAPDVGSEADVESFMRGGRRARRPGGRREPEPPVSAPDDPDHTATRPISASGPGISARPPIGSGSAPATEQTSSIDQPLTANFETTTAGGVESDPGGRRRGAGRADTAPTGRGGAHLDGADRSSAGRGGAKRGSTGRATRDAGRSRPGTGIDMAKVAVGLVVVLLIATGVIIGRQVLGGDEELPEAGTPGSGATAEPTDLCGGPQPAPNEPPPAVTDWAQEVHRLYELRTRAFTELDATLLCDVYAPTSESLARDVETLQEYADAEVHPEGLSFEVIDVTLVSENGGSVTVEITDQITEHQLVDGDGDTLKSFPAVETDTWQADLVAVAGPDGGPPTWRLE